MIDITMLGCAGMVPLKNRWLSSLYAVSDGHAILFDCGEGTQIALSEAGCRAKQIDTICLTHVHQDHVGGIAGMLLAMHNANREEDVVIIGPPGTHEVVQHLMVVAGPAFPIYVQETDGSKEEVFQTGDLEIRPFPVDHVIPCLGYQVKLPRSGRFDPEKASKLGIPVTSWSHLQRGEALSLEDGRTILPEDVIGPPRPGLSFVYSTDTRPIESIVEAGRGSDLMILEGNYADDDKMDKAQTWGHMTFRQAATLARDAGAKKLWLTHFSQSIENPEAHLEKATCVFPNTEAGYNGKHTVLKFQD